MKKTLLSCMLLAGLSANAQLADGSIAPNFTFTDTDGTVHTLYDYLDQGKTVVLDVSAAWCGPCWNFHNSHALKDLYEAHGPTGFPDVQANTTNDVMVLFVEGEQDNTPAQITGTSGSGVLSSQGDWTVGTTYPIIDLPSDAAGNSFMTGYAIGYFPTVYMICPNRLVTEIGVTPNGTSYYTGAQIYALTDECPAPASAAADVAALAYTGDINKCDGNYTPKVRIQNNGTSPLTSATVTVTSGATTVSTGTYSGNLATYGVAEVTCTQIAGYTGGTLNITVTTTGDASATNNVVSQLIETPEVTGYAITVKVFTDNYPAETTWEIRNSANAVVASGGPYQGNGNSAGGADALQTKTHNVTLPSVNDCYKIIVKDSYGDGFAYGTNPAGQYGLEVVSNGQSIINLDLGDFGNTFTRDAAMITDETSSIIELAANNFQIYPNPATDVVNVSFEALNSDYVVSLVDLTGRVLMSNEYKALNGAQVIEMPVSGLAKGNYLVKITANGASLVQQVAIK